jgi:Tfp pilus assembly protein PilN
MTTTALPETGENTEPVAAPAPDLSWRIIPIGANLLPDEIMDARRVRKVRWIVITSLVLFIGLLVAWYLRATTVTDDAEVTAVRAQTQVQKLQKQQKEFDQVVSVQADSKAISSQLSTLFGKDLQWAKLSGEVQAAAPKGISLTAVLGSVTLGNAVPEAGSGHLPSTSVEKTIGAVTVSGTGPDKATIAAYVDALAKVPGLANPQISDVALQDGRLRFSVRLDITAARLGGRFATPAPSASAATEGAGK